MSIDNSSKSDSPLAMQAALYIVATPLGHAQDLSLRALAILRAVDVVAAEDTRHSQRLFDVHGLSPRMMPLHEHNEREGAERIIAMLADGKHVALVSDAGTPAISDPGSRLVAAVQAAGHKVVPIPGACAAIAALSASGLAAPHFLFHGFLPNKSAARCAAIESVRSVPASLVFYEAPHRIVECVADLAAVLEPTREIVFARELTKLFEQIARMPLAEANAWLAADSNRQRGEFVLLVGPAPESDDIAPRAQQILQLLSAELPLKTAAKLTAELTGESKNRLYELGLNLKK